MFRLFFSSSPFTTINLPAWAKLITELKRETNKAFRVVLTEKEQQQAARKKATVGRGKDTPIYGSVVSFAKHPAGTLSNGSNGSHPTLSVSFPPPARGHTVTFGPGIAEKDVLVAAAEAVPNHVNTSPPRHEAGHPHGGRTRRTMT